MNIRSFKENDFPAILKIYAESKIDELRYEEIKFELLPLENDEMRLTELRELSIYVYEVCSCNFTVGKTGQGYLMIVPMMIFRTLSRHASCKLDRLMKWNRKTNA